MSNTTSKKTTAGRPNYSARKALPPNDIAAGSGMPPGALPFNAVVQLTVDAEVRAKAREEAMKRDEAKARMELSGIYVPRFHRRSGDAIHNFDDEEVPPFIYGKMSMNRGPDHEGFTEVKRKTRKPKRELTTAELNAKMMEPPSDDEDGEVNAELYDTARQHEHY